MERLLAKIIGGQSRNGSRDIRETNRITLCCSKHPRQQHAHLCTGGTALHCYFGGAEGKSPKERLQPTAREGKKK